MNIDALKETEHALQTREHQLLGIIETIPAMLWSASPDGEPTHLSQRFLEYRGTSFEEFVKRGWDGLHSDDREESAMAFFRAIETGESYNVIHRYRRADGEYRWHHSMGEPLRDPTARSFSGMVFRSTSMIGNRQKTILGIRATSSAQRRKSQL
jgi:PAS domain S-box-containing protein